MYDTYLLVGLIVAGVMACIVFYWVIIDNREGTATTRVTTTEGQPKQLVAVLTERTARGALNEAWDAGFKLAVGLNRLNREQRRNVQKGFVQKKRAEKVELISDRLVGKAVDEKPHEPEGTL